MQLFDVYNIILFLSVLSLFFDRFHIFLISHITSFSFTCSIYFTWQFVTMGARAGILFFCKVILLRCYGDSGNVCE